MKYLKDVNWELLYDKTRLTIHGLTVAVNAVSFGLILKSYIKYVHNRPMELGLNPNQIESRKLLKNRQLGLLCVFGIPLTLWAVRTASVGLKDCFTVNVGGVGGSEGANNNSNFINSILFLSNLIKKIQDESEFQFEFYL